MPLLLLACCAASALAAFMAAGQISQTSDTVQSFLAAQSILHGNLLLAGWHFTIDDFFFSDTLPFAAFEGVFGSRIIALVVIPTLVYALIVAACLAASLRSLRWSRDNFASVATILLLIGLPPFGIFVPLLLADFHGGSILFALVALLLLSGITKSSPIQYRQLRVFAFAVLTIAAVSSDPFALVFAFGPILLVLGIEFLAADYGIEGLGLMVLVASCSMIGFFLPTAIAHFGGFVIEPTVEESFVTAEHLGKTLAGFFFGFLYSSGAYVFGKHPLDLDTRANGARFVGWLIGGVAVLTRIPVICRPRSDGLLDRLLLASLAAIVSACVLSRWFDVSVPDSVLNGGAGTRFIAPALVFAAILAARAIPQMIGALPTQRFRFSATAFIVMLAGGLLIGHMRAGASLVTSPPWTAQG